MFSTKRVSIPAALVAACVGCGARTQPLDLQDATTADALVSDGPSNAGSEGGVCLANGAACSANASCCSGHCGDGTCRIAGPCRPGDAPIMLVSDVSPYAFNIAIDEDGVFYPSSVGRIARVSKYGGPGQARVNADTQVLAIDGSTLFFAQRPVDCSAVGCSQLARASAWGGEPTVLATEVRAATGLGVGADVVVWSEISDGVGAGRIRTAAKAGGPSQVIAQGFTLQAPILINDEVVYFNDGSTLRSMPLGTGTVTALTGPGAAFGGIATDSAMLYFGGPNGGVVRMPRAGGAPMTVVSGMPAAWDIAVDAASVYFTTLNADGSVRKVLKTGGTTTVLAQGTYSIGIAVDEDCVYYLNSAGPPANPPMVLYKVAK